MTVPQKNILYIALFTSKNVIKAKINNAVLKNRYSIMVVFRTISALEMTDATVLRYCYWNRISRYSNH